MKVFIEEQRFKQIWLQVLLIITSVTTVAIDCRRSGLAASDQNTSAHMCLQS